MYIESLTEQLNNPELLKEDNPGRMVLDGTICEYLENYDNHIYDCFITRATSKYLDLHASEYDIFRRPGESDISLRNRLLVEIRIIQNTDNILDLSDNLWVYLDNVLTDKNVLTSRNPYLKELHDTEYVFIVSSVNKDYIKGKFLLKDILFV